MKRFILIAFAFITGMGESGAQNFRSPIPDGIYYLVRHAEKDTGKNPALTAAGYVRSGDLFRTLKKKRINNIYVSQYLRTQLTADSIRIYQQIDTSHYKADTTGNDLINKITTREKGSGNILIIGHSNTIPAIIKKFGITNFEAKELPDHEYDNLFVINIKKNKISLKKLKYGKVSISTVLPAKMNPLQ